MKNNFFVIEGPDGCGKTTLINNLKAKFQDRDDVVFCHDPGTTELGMHLRSLLKDDAYITEPLDIRTTMLLFSAVRNELSTKVITPALEAGKIVICDRYLLSTLVYQGVDGNLPLDEIINIHMQMRMANPKLTFLLTANSEVLINRVKSRNVGEAKVDKYEASDMTLRSRVLAYRFVTTYIQNTKGCNIWYPILKVSAEDSAADVCATIYNLIITNCE